VRRHRLVTLEKTGLVLEYASMGYGGASISNGVSELPFSGDTLEDEKLRIYMIKKARQEAVNRARRMRRLRRLARMDFKMVGGVAPVGFYGGAGGGGGSSRPGSMSARS
jgi:hypothetical protein